jgi:RHH-type proline utilization regulon transcriptional repressor/proline dehydrogenase/delta 1-pyrroline-5-carboxylate dehydrogenase
VVDSSALAEQVVADAVSSAFDSAGQRCSALRVLCVQRDVAERMLQMLDGAVRELRVGDPRRLATDVGPVIDDEARAGIERHLQRMAARGHRIRCPAPPGDTTHGSFVTPTIVEIDSIDALQREVFGPVLHVLRFEREGLDALLAQINATGYALTMGVHTRIDETVARVVGAARAGNLYVNRNIVGAVVGVQPFGGEGLSGTGPKAGGPLYLLRLLQSAPAYAARRAVLAAGAAPAGTPLRGLSPGDAADDALAQLLQWARQGDRSALAQACAGFLECTPIVGTRALPGPTGESNLYALQPREAVLCLAEDDADRLLQLAAVLAVGGHALWPAAEAARLHTLPEALQARVLRVQDWTRAEAHFDTVLLHGDGPRRLQVAAQLAQRPGPIVPLLAFDCGDAFIPLEWLVVERSVSINTAAAGGNASLMSIG